MTDKRQCVECGGLVGKNLDCENCRRCRSPTVEDLDAAIEAAAKAKHEGKPMDMAQALEAVGLSESSARAAMDKQVRVMRENARRNRLAGNTKTPHGSRGSRSGLSADRESKDDDSWR